jgi:hypothetical protein
MTDMRKEATGNVEYISPNKTDIVAKRRLKFFYIFNCLLLWQPARKKSNQG